MARQTKETRGSRGSGSVRQRKDGRWEARCTINGRTRSFYGARQIDVLKAMRAAQQESDEGTYIDPSTLTFGRWMEIWLEEYSKQTIKPNTYASRQILINTHIKPKLGSIRLQSIDASILQGFYNDLHNKDGLAPSSIQVYHASIHSALDRAVKLRYINFNPAKACVLPKMSRKNIKPLSDLEIADFMTLVRSDPLRDLLLITLFTGMREGEVCGLSWDAVDFDAGTITVKQQLVKDWQNGGYAVGTPKNGRARTLTAPPFVMEILQEVYRIQEAQRTEAGDLWLDDERLVFTDRIGGAILPTTAYRHFKRIAARIGRPDARFHDLRHTYAVIALQEGDNPKTVQEALGHATAEFTMNVYAHVSEKMKKESAARMQGFYERMEG